MFASLVNVVCCEGTGFCDWPIPLPEEPHRACVCVCVCVTAIRYNINPLHLAEIRLQTVCSTFMHVSALQGHLQEISVSVNY